MDQNNFKVKIFFVIIFFVLLLPLIFFLIFKFNNHEALDSIHLLFGYLYLAFIARIHQYMMSLYLIKKNNPEFEIPYVWPFLIIILATFISILSDWLVLLTLGILIFSSKKGSLNFGTSRGIKLGFPLFLNIVNFNIGFIPYFLFYRDPKIAINKLIQSSKSSEEIAKLETFGVLKVFALIFFVFFAGLGSIGAMELEASYIKGFVFIFILALIFLFNFFISNRINLICEDNLQD